MLLRSSSTPILGSLLSSVSESPNNNYHQSESHGPIPKSTPNSTRNKLSYTNNGSQNFSSKSFLYSPSLPEIKGTNTTPQNNLRRVQSAGNLDELVESVDEFTFSKKFARKPVCRTLEAIPSFSFNKSGNRFEDDDTDDDDDEEELEWGGVNNQFRAENLVLEEAGSNVNDYGGLRFEDFGKMYLAAGLGVSGANLVVGGGHGGGGRGGGGGGGGYRPDRDGGDSRGLSMEEHYQKMLQCDPGNPLVLRNYAQFLYQTKGDLEGAEEYYSRAILSDPNDGEVLSQYAKLIWELHHDKERALNYFERAVQASSEDSHIHAAYAGFLWDIDGDEDEGEEHEAEESRLGAPLFHHGFMAPATTV